MRILLGDAVTEPSFLVARRYRYPDSRGYAVTLTHQMQGTHTHTCWQKVTLAGRRGLSRMGLRPGEQNMESMGPAVWVTIQEDCLA